MTCPDYRDALVDLARSAANDMPAELRAHLAQCAACAACFERERTLTSGLRALAQSTASAQASAQTETRLMEAFAAGQVSVAERSSAWRSIAAIAAAIVLVVGAAAAWRTFSGRPTEPGRPVNAGPVVSTTASTPPAVVATHRDEPAAAPALIAPAAQRPRPARKPPRPVQPAGFVALPGTAGLPQFESGEIMRLDMSLATLASYGIDISRAGVAAPVQADLLFGQDGQARAIRLVRTDTTSRSRQ